MRHTYHTYPYRDSIRKTTLFLIHDVLHLANRSLYGEAENVGTTHKETAPPAPADDCEECFEREDILMRMTEQIKSLEEDLAEARRQTFGK